VVPEAALLGDARGVDDVQAQLAREGHAAEGDGETVPHLGGGPRGVEDQRGAVVAELAELDAVEELRLVARRRSARGSR
jgi:hypothetical protein